MSSFRRPTNTNAGSSILYGGNDLHVITDMLNGTVSGIPPVKLKTTNGVEFWDGILKFRNDADTFSMTIKAPTLAANRNLTLPSISVNDTIAALIASQTFTNKTINLADNTVTATSAVAGEIAVHNGTKFVRLAAGTASQFLRGDGTWQLPPGAGGGEANVGSNVGTATGKVYKGMNGTVLEFKSVGGTSSKISTTNGTNDVTFDVVEANLTLTNLGGTLSVAKGGTGATTLTGILKGNGTSAFTAVTAPTGAIVGTTDTQTLTNKTLNTTDNTLNATSIATGDILKSNGTKFIRMARGTANQVLSVNSGGTDLVWATPESAQPSGSSIIDDYSSGGMVYGWHYPHGIIGGGLLNNVANDIVEANTSTVYSNTADKGYGRRITGIDGGAEGNIFYGIVSLPFRRECDCFVDFWMQLNAINCRVYAFFTDDTTPTTTSDAPLDTDEGFGIMATLAGNFRRVSNNNSSSQQLDGSDLFPKDTTLRHIRIESDTANNKWIITVNDTPTDYTYASINGPAASTPMFFKFNIDESGGSVDQLLDIYKFKCGYKLP